MIVYVIEDALRLIAARGQAIAEKCEAGVGGMVAVFAPEADVLKSLKKVGSKEVAVAAVNGPKMTVVSGRKADVDKVVADTGATGKALTVSHGFHSPMMTPALAPFQKEADTVTFGVPKVRFFSTLKGKEAFRGSHLSNTTCLTHVILQKWRIMQQVQLAALDK